MQFFQNNAFASGIGTVVVGWTLCLSDSIINILVRNVPINTWVWREPSYTMCHTSHQGGTSNMVSVRLPKNCHSKFSIILQEQSYNKEMSCNQLLLRKNMRLITFSSITDCNWFNSTQNIGIFSVSVRCVVRSDIDGVFEIEQLLNMLLFSRAV